MTWIGSRFLWTVDAAATMHGHPPPLYAPVGQDNEQQRVHQEPPGQKIVSSVVQADGICHGTCKVSQQSWRSKTLHTSKVEAVLQTKQYLASVCGKICDMVFERSVSQVPWYGHSRLATTMRAVAWISLFLIVDHIDANMNYSLSVSQQRTHDSHWKRQCKCDSESSSKGTNSNAAFEWKSW